MGYWFYFPFMWSFIFIDRPCTFFFNKYLSLHKYIFFYRCQRELSRNDMSRNHVLLLSNNLQKLTEKSPCNFRRPYIVLIYLGLLFSDTLYIQHFCLSSRVLVKIKTVLAPRLVLGLGNFRTRL